MAEIRVTSVIKGIHIMHKNNHNAVQKVTYAVKGVQSALGILKTEKLLPDRGLL